MWRVLRRATSGKTSCTQGICDGCGTFAGCKDRNAETCESREQNDDRATPDADPHSP
jgi:hypothetical protein